MSAHGLNATRDTAALVGAPGGQLLLPAPPKTRSGRAAAILADRWNVLRNDMRLTVEDHMIAAPVIMLTAGFLAGQLLRAAMQGRRDDFRDR